MQALKAIRFPTARGSRAREMRDCIYHIPRSGHIYTTPCMSAEISLRFYCVVSLTARGAPFILRVGDQIQHPEAVALKATIARGVRSEEKVRLVSCQIDVRHPAFRAFRAIAPPGFKVLNRDDFTPLDDILDAAYGGKLSIAEASALFDSIVRITLRSLPPVDPLDPRVTEAIKLLRANSSMPLGELATTIGVSYDRMSHLFADSIGLPLKSYQLWQKLHHAVGLLPTGLSLTAIAHAAGFADSAHLSKTFLHVYGAPPSYFLDREKVQLFAESRATSHG